MGFRQDVSIEDMLGVRAPHGFVIAHIEAEEIVGTPVGQEELAHAFSNSFFRHDKVSPANDRTREQEPPHGVCAIALKHLRDIGVIAQALGHLGAIRPQDNAVRNDVGKGRSVKQRCGENMHRVKPATGLTDVLHNEICGVMRVKPFLVVKGVMHLGKRHRARVKPHI